LASAVKELIPTLQQCFAMLLDQLLNTIDSSSTKTAAALQYYHRGLDETESYERSTTHV